MDMYQKMKQEADGVADNAEQYVRLQTERFRLELIERLSLSITDMIYLMVIGFFMFGGLLLVCVAVGLVVQQITGNWIISALGAILLFSLMAYVAIRYGKTHIRDAITKAIVNSVYDEEK